MRLPDDLRHFPTQRELDIRRAVELEKFGLVFTIIAILAVTFL